MTASADENNFAQNTISPNSIQEMKVLMETFFSNFQNQSGINESKTYNSKLFENFCCFMQKQYQEKNIFNIDTKINQFIYKSHNSPKDLSNEEFELAQHYNEILDRPDLLNQFDIARHHRILVKAIELNKVDYRKFLNFINSSITKYKNSEIQSLLVNFQKCDFSDCSDELQLLQNNTFYQTHYLDYENDRYINFFNEQNQFQRKFDDLKKQNEELKSLIIDLKNQMTLQNHNLQTQINELQLDNEKLIKQNEHLQIELFGIQKVPRPIENQTKIQPIQEILSNSTRIQQSNDNHMHLTYRFVSLDRFSGLLHYFHRKRQLIISIPCQEEIDNNNKVTNLVDYSNPNETWYSSPSRPFANYIEFSFQSNKIRLFSYQIKSSPNSQNTNHPKAWEILGSNSRITWNILDTRDNCLDLNEKSVTKHFVCNSPTQQFYQYIRFHQINNWNSDPYCQSIISLSRFELYGEVMNAFT